MNDASNATATNVGPRRAALWLVLAQPVIRARLQFLPSVACAGMHRKALARGAEHSIAGALNLRAANP